MTEDVRGSQALVPGEPVPGEPASASRRAVLALGTAGVAGALAGCEVYGPPEAPPPPPPPPPEPTDDAEELDDNGDDGDDEEPDDEGDEPEDDEPDGITLAELEAGDGRDGRRCLVAVDGVVYEIDGFALWQDGEHAPSNGQAYCGADMSDVIRQAPHGVGRVDALIEIGPLIT